MSLVDLVDNTITDKNQAYVYKYETGLPRGHTYLPLYEELFNKKKETATNILEIGVQRGGSIKLWADYFKNANIYGIDINIDKNQPCVNKLLKNERVTLIQGDAYEEDIYTNFKLNDFDIVLDDGPHTLDSMKVFIKEYLGLLKDDGILVIEDIFFPEWFDVLKQHVPNNLLKYVKTYDRRQVMNKHNDLVFVIDKSATNI